MGWEEERLPPISADSEIEIGGGEGKKGKFLPPSPWQKTSKWNKSKSF